MSSERLTTEINIPNAYSLCWLSHTTLYIRKTSTDNAYRCLFPPCFVALPWLCQFHPNYSALNRVSNPHFSSQPNINRLFPKWHRSQCSTIIMAWKSPGCNSFDSVLQLRIILIILHFEIVSEVVYYVRHQFSFSSLQFILHLIFKPSACMQ